MDINIEFVVRYFFIIPANDIEKLFSMCPESLFFIHNNNSDRLIGISTILMNFIKLQMF